MNFFEQALRTFTGKDTSFKSSKPIYADRACFLRLSEDCIARIKFVSIKLDDEYDALLITIINRNCGEVDQIRLRFEDYCKPHEDGCSIMVTPFILDEDEEDEDGKAEWYVAPTDSEIKTIASTAYDYIQLFA